MSCWKQRIGSGEITHLVVKPLATFSNHFEGSVFVAAATLFLPMQTIRPEIRLVMFPVLVTMYVKLARREEKKAMAEFGDKYRRYMVRTPAFIPHLRGHHRMNEA
jgi:protein-S-isoprenylcysteine O-methyltransferase Ste14